MATQDIISALIKDAEDELSSIIQYLLHHYEAKGLESEAIIGVFEKHALDEMKHYETLSERITFLGGETPSMPSEIKRGGSLQKMIQDDIVGEEKAVAQYKEHIKLADKEGDPTTRHLLEEILTTEEKHLDDLQRLLGR